MMHFNFIASNRISFDDFDNIDTFITIYPDFQTVPLNDEQELKLLLQLIGIESCDSMTLQKDNFSKYWNLSNYRFPEFNKEQFDDFYIKWLEISGKENTMDEFETLIFLHGLSKKWNRLKFRAIVLETQN